MNHPVRPRIHQLFGGRAGISIWLSHLKKLSVTIVAFGASYFVYLSAGYVVYPDFEAIAVANAWRVIELEQRIGIFWEPAWQEWVLDHPLPWAERGGLTVLFNWVYILAFAPFMVTISVIVYAANRPAFRHYRKILLLSLGIAMTMFIAFPLAPPRMIPSHFVDTIATFGPPGYASQGIGKYYNPYAAMPSLHFGWAIVFSVFFLRVPNVLVKISGLIYPTLVLSAIVVTGNHYIMDAIAGGLVILASFLLIELNAWQRTLRPAHFLAQKLPPALRFRSLSSRHQPCAGAGEERRCTR